MHESFRTRTLALAVLAAALLMTLPGCMIVVAKGDPESIDEWWDEDETFEIEPGHADDADSAGSAGSRGSDDAGRRERDRLVVGDGDTIGPFSDGIRRGRSPAIPRRAR